MMVLSMDRYSDLWEPFFFCLNRYGKCRMPRYLVTNEKTPALDGVTVIPTGPEVSWSRRVRQAVQRVPAKYIFVMLEDYFLLSELSDAMTARWVDFLERQQADYLRVYPFPKLKFSQEAQEGICPLPPDALYGVNLQPSIWKREFLLRALMQDDFSAWEFEARQKNGAPGRLDGSFFAVRQMEFAMANGVLQGKWYPPSLKALARHGIFVDTGTRPVLSRRRVAAYRLKQILRQAAGPDRIRRCKPLLRKLGIHFVTE